MENEYPKQPPPTVIQSNWVSQPSIHESESFYKQLFTFSSPICFDEKMNFLSPLCSEKLHPTSNKMALIIDTRFDEIMENVIRNFMFFMNPLGWNLMIISHPMYESIIKDKFPYCIFGKIEEDLIFYDENQIPNISMQTYNQILLSPYLWNSLQGEHIAIFQKDCIMYNMFDEFFLNYDFAGANTYLPPFQTFYHGMMNGGFSLRKKSTMLECLEKVNCQIINNYISTMKESIQPFLEDKSNFSALRFEKFKNCFHEYTLENINEDIFFSFACEILHKKIPDIEHRKKLSIEFEEPIYLNNVPNQTSLPAVYHGWNKNYHSVEAAKYFISFSSYPHFQSFRNEVCMASL